MKKTYCIVTMCVCLIYILLRFIGVFNEHIVCPEIVGIACSVFASVLAFIFSRKISRKYIEDIYVSYRHKMLERNRLTWEQVKMKLSFNKTIYLEDSRRGYRVVLRPISDTCCILSNQRSGKSVKMRCSSVLSELKRLVDADSELFCYSSDEV